MNTIYLYKYLWFIEFLIFINLCNDIYAEQFREIFVIDQDQINERMFKTTCESFGYLEKTHKRLYKSCIRMVKNLEPNLNPSDMVKISDNITWRTTMMEATDILNIFIKYKWGLTEYGLFLQQLGDKTDRISILKNVMEAMPWPKWKLFCDNRFATIFDTYKIMPLIITSKEHLEKLTEYMMWLHETVDKKQVPMSNKRRGRNEPTEVEQFGCTYPFVATLIDLINKREGSYSNEDINRLYYTLCIDSYYKKWDLQLFRKIFNEAENSDIKIDELINILKFGDKVVTALNLFDDSEVLKITQYNQYLKLCKNNDLCMQDLSSFLENIILNTNVDAQTVCATLDNCGNDTKCDVSDLLALLDRSSLDMENITVNQRDCSIILVIKLYDIYKLDNPGEKIMLKKSNIKNITEEIKKKTWSICDYNELLEKVYTLKMNGVDFQKFRDVNFYEKELYKVTEILVYISKLQINDIWSKMVTMNLKSSYKFVEILKWKEGPITEQSLTYYFNLDQPIDCHSDILKAVISYNEAIAGNLSKDEHEKIYKMLCPTEDIEKINRIINYINSVGLTIKNPTVMLTMLLNVYFGM
ncbi:uncharacterized protein LOC142334123 [Lycorma delicatula]|uniref:uncharacterized protein LOC142334123 n=1 Tax=Lycorma delicatula TaxID=130591 RepID=UPI003F51212A